jgi:hypothetical protein
MRSPIPTVLLILLIFAASVHRAHAATFTKDDFGAITMRGPISSGDAERLAAVFIEVKPILPNSYLLPGLLYLNSPGGDVSEAMRLSALIKALGLTVAVVPDGLGSCASSCFLLYVSGIERSATGMDTIRSAGAKGNLGPIGIHRPYYREHATGPKGAESQENLMKLMREHLMGLGISHTLIDRMMTHASNDIYWLNAEDIRSIGRYSPGVEEQLISRCAYNARSEAKMSAREWISSTRAGALACVADYLNKTYTPLRNAAVERMRNGWRPFP